MTKLRFVADTEPDQSHCILALLKFPNGENFIRGIFSKNILTDKLHLLAGNTSSKFV